MNWWHSLPESTRFRARHMTFSALLILLMVLVGTFGTMPWWFGLVLMALLMAWNVSFVRRYEAEEARWRSVR